MDYAIDVMTMVDLVRDMILAAAGVLVLVVLNRMNLSQSRVPKGVWPFILVGFMLLLFGRVLEMIPSSEMMLDPLTKGILQEVTGFCLGFILLSVGLIRWLPQVLLNGSPQPRRERRTTVGTGTGSRPLSPHHAHEMLTSVLKSSLSGVAVLKAKRDQSNEVIDFDFVLLNEAAEQILGRSSANLVGRGILRELACIRQENLLGHAVSVIETGLPYRSERRFANDHGRWYQFVAVKLGDGLALTFADVSDRKQAEEQLRHAAHHDTLTKLPNRALFTERLNQAINRSKRFPDYKFAVLFLDFDRFKIVNDTLGHDAGDQLLSGIADRLRANLREIDTSSRMTEGHLPARLGGDEFVILLEDTQDVNDAVTVAERLQAQLSVPHTIDGHEVVSTASIGIVSSDLGYETSDDIIRDADTAMYQAKTSGKARHVVFNEQMHQAVADRASLERELQLAAIDMAFDLEFNPFVDLETGTLAGFQALVRWPHPEHGMLHSSEFLGVAEEIGITVPLGGWLLGRAAAQVRSWQQQFPGHESLAISVALAKQQLQSPDLAETVERVLQETGLDGSCLQLSVKETMVTEDLARLAPVLSRLAALGVRIVLDGFGTGQSSFRCLHQFPVNLIKLDEDLVTGARTRRDYGAVVHAVVELAHNLDMGVLAAGIQTTDQLALLQGLDCEYAQGPVFSESVDADSAAELLRRDAPFGATLAREDPPAAAA